MAGILLAFWIMLGCGLISTNAIAHSTKDCSLDKTEVESYMQNGSSWAPFQQVDNSESTLNIGPRINAYSDQEIEDDDEEKSVTYFFSSIQLDAQRTQANTDYSPVLCLNTYPLYILYQSWKIFLD